jgi:uncharacterized SAM-binding protein YcdF (DUF218 family)
MAKSYLYPPHVRLGPSPVCQAPAAPQPQTTSRRFSRRWLLLLAPLLLLLTAPLWLPWCGTFLVASDEPTPADAIVVLAGNAPDRLPRALELWRAGYAPLLVVSNENIHTYGLDTTWYDLYRAHLAAQDLPPEALIILDNPVPDSTIDEARRDAAILQARGLHRALLVTDAFHSRRASLLFAAQFRHLALEVRSTPVLESDPDIAHWWAHPMESRRVSEEWTKLLIYLLQGSYF